MKKIRILAYTCLLVLFAMPFWGAQYLHLSNYTLSINDSISTLSPDTTLANTSRVFRDSILLTDTISVDSVLTDSVKPKPNALDAIVDFKSNDSIVMTKNNWGYLYGEAQIDYTEIKLTGEIISMNMDSNYVEAIYGVDSIGKEFGYPIFTDGGTDYETKTMKYNFKTKKGFSQHLVTEQGEGFVVAGRAKKNEDNSFFMREGKYTTCDQHDHPHFYLALTKAKVQPKKNVVTGPAYLVIEGLHIPFIGLPFGFFPFSDSYSSGVIMPSYGDEMDRGFNLHDGGYYFAINDYVDLKLLGTIYTKGSWGLNAQSTYKKRYKFSGNVNMGYQVSKYGDKDLPDYSQTKDFKLSWSHSQDPKSNMFRTLSANVNFATQSYDRNNLNTQYMPASTSNTRSSTVTFTQRFPSSTWSLSGSMSVNQVSSNKSMAMTAPNLTASMSRIFPFQRKEAVGTEKWYEKIQISYTGEFRNSISTTEDHMSLALRNWDNAMKHSIPISATFSVFDYLNITPSVQYTERWYTKKVTQRLENGVPRPNEKENSLKRVYDFSASLGFQTKLFGFYEPLFAKGTRIRHVFTPSVTLSASPDFSQPMWGFYESLYGYDNYGVLQEYKYSPYASQMFGTAPSQASGTISFDFQNNLEMKTPWESDSTGYKKISLIDNLGINFSYNSQVDSMRWSDIRTNLRLKLSKSLTVNLSATFDPYLYDFVDNNVPKPQRRLKRINQLRIQHGKGFGRLRSTSYSISPSINQDTFNKWFGKDEKKKKGKDGSDASSEDGDDKVSTTTKRLLGDSGDSSGDYDSDGYVKNEVKWNLGISFSMNYGYDMSKIDYNTKEYKMKLGKSLSFNGALQPTKHWNMSFYGSYDFETKKIPLMSLTLTRDLHCWSISGSVTPVGLYKSYFVSIRANSSLLQDLKHEFRGRSSSYDPNWD